MCNETKSFLLFCLIVGITTVGVSWAISWAVVKCSEQEREVTIEAMNKGYEKGLIPGSSYLHWVKKKERQ